MRENPDDHGQIFDGGDEFQASATMWAVFDVDIEHALEQLRPTHARRRAMGVPGCMCVGLVRPRNDRGAQSGIGREHPMKVDQKQARPRHQRGEALHDLQRRHHDTSGAVAVGAFEPQHDLAGAVAFEPFVGNGRAGDGAALRVQVPCADGRHNVLLHVS